MGQILDCFCNGIEFTQSHRPEEVIPDSYDKCEAGFGMISASHRSEEVVSDSCDMCEPGSTRRANCM